MNTALAIVPSSPLAVVAPKADLTELIAQPVEDVQSYLELRKPCAFPNLEPGLESTLPTRVRNEVHALLDAFAMMAQLISDGLATAHSAAPVVVRHFSMWPWSASRLRARYDLWKKTGDWVCLVNRAKAGGQWIQQKRGIPLEFLKYCAQRIFRFIRNDARKEALRSICREYMTGRKDDGTPASIPGYVRPPHPHKCPEGWSYDNIMALLKRYNLLPKAVHKYRLQGTAAARTYLPQVNGTRDGLRFMELVEFDDVKIDFRVIDIKTGKVCDLWLLVARDKATTMLLGYVMRPALVREDGSQEHLKLSDMKQLCGFVLERRGLPPYRMIWKMERGTATLGEGTRRAIAELLGGRVEIHYSTMLGGTSPAGFVERAIGNSKGKATLESLNRPIHIIGANLPGQTGPLYTVRPADLAAREKESIEIWKLSKDMPAEMRERIGYTLLTIQQARMALNRIFTIQNFRTDHTLEGFDKIAEWYDPARGLWLPQSTAPEILPSGAEVRTRMESPVERAAALVRGCQWTSVSPAVITAFYEHTSRWVVVEDSSEIVFQHEGKPLRFIASITPGTKCLAYFHPDDPIYLHLTDGKGSFYPTAIRKDKVRCNDADALRAACHCSAAALKAARDVAMGLAEPEREELDALRASNAAVQAEYNDMTLSVVSEPVGMAQHENPVASGLAAVATKRGAHKAEARAEESLRQTARAALMD